MSLIVQRSRAEATAYRLDAERLRTSLVRTACLTPVDDIDGRLLDANSNVARRIDQLLHWADMLDQAND